MRALTMDYQLTIPAIMQQAETLSPSVEIVSRRSDRTLHRYGYADMVRRAKKLAVALQELDIRPGERVGTLAANHHQHLEAYFAVPSMGAVLHTLNPRLHARDLAAIAAHARDRIMFVDASMLPQFEQWRGSTSVEHVVVMGADGQIPGTIDYELLVTRGDEHAFVYPRVDEWQGAAMCYTSGTTGSSKGVVYSHRAIVLEAMHWTAADVVGAGRKDVMLAVVPMCHINGWGIPFTAALVGAKLVLPGSSLDARSLLELVESERVTVSAGVPTVWLQVLAALDDKVPCDTSSLRMVVIGGSAVPESLLRGLDRHGIHVRHVWGMTETTAVATIGSPAEPSHLASQDDQYRLRAKQGRPVPFVEVRARAGDTLVAWDGRTLGELEVRGPTVTGAYADCPEGDSCFTDDGWFRTGDIVAIDPDGCVEVHDRAKDLIRSGGEWISSVRLENALMGHPAVAEAAVIAVTHPKWGERPLACVVLKRGETIAPGELRNHLAQGFPKWWLPDCIEFVEAIPRSATGKFLKSALRERYAGAALTPVQDTEL